MAASSSEKKRVPFILRFQLVEGLLISLGILYLGYYYLQPLLPLPESNDYTSKLRYVIISSILPCSTLIWAIAGVLRKRTKKVIVNPLAGREHNLQVEHNFAQNTLEQLMVYLISTAVLATYLVGEELKYIPLNALVFTLGRILFRVGYGIHPSYRGLGVACFFASQVVTLSLCTYFLYTHGIMYGLEGAVDAPSPGPTTAQDNLPKQEL